MNNTDLRISRDIGRGCSNKRIARKLGRPLTDELDARIDKIRRELCPCAHLTHEHEPGYEVCTLCAEHK